MTEPLATRPSRPGDAPAGRRTGTGYAACHHGEILQGVFRDEAGRACPGLVTLPLSGLGSRAVFVRETRTPPGLVTVTPGDRTKARRAAALAVEECARRRRQSPSGGYVRLHSNVPVGLGMGSSTSDVVATVRAVADAFDDHLSAHELARLAVTAEQASDPVMLGRRPLLFAQREGHVLEDLGDRLPPAVVVGCVTGGGAPVDTLDTPAHAYSVADVDTFEDLRACLREAVTRADAALLGRVSTESARHQQRHVPTPELDLLEDVARRAGAVGVQVAHSGNVAGLVFAEQDPELPGRLRRCVREIRHHGLETTRLFRTPRPSSRGQAWTTTSPKP